MIKEEDFKDHLTPKDIFKIGVVVIFLAVFIWLLITDIKESSKKASILHTERENTKSFEKNLNE